MKTPKTNLIVLKKSRRKPEAGDIFAFQLEPLPNKFFFGRVVATDTNIGNVTEGGIILVYLYRTSSTGKTNVPSLPVSDILIPPIGTNALAWTRGYFETVSSGVNAKEDLLGQHCFLDPMRGWYFDEYGVRLPGPVGLVGIDGVSGIASVDIKISEALGLPLKEED